MGKQVPADVLFEEIEWFTSQGCTVWDALNALGLSWAAARRQANRYKREDILELMTVPDERW
jgi:hypothetical protein